MQITGTFEYICWTFGEFSSKCLIAKRLIEYFIISRKNAICNRHGTKFWKILKSQNFGHIDIDFDIENYSFKILILILILKFAFQKYWFWYWYWNFWDFWYWYWYWYWKKMGEILKIWGVRMRQVDLPDLEFLLDFLFFPFKFWDL